MLSGLALLKKSYGFFAGAASLVEASRGQAGSDVAEVGRLLTELANARAKREHAEKVAVEDEARQAALEAELQVAQEKEREAAGELAQVRGEVAVVKKIAADQV